MVTMATSLPNLLTYSRIAAIPVVVGLILSQLLWAEWLALGIYIAACITDFLDGYLARAWQQQSSLGRFLDPIADKLLIASLLMVMVGVDTIGSISIMPALVILCREFLVSGLREYLAEVRVGLPVSRLAKWKTGIQMTAIGFLVVSDSEIVVLGITPVEVGIVGLWIAALLTLVTGYDYLRHSYDHIERSQTVPETVDAVKVPESGSVRSSG